MDRSVRSARVAETHTGTLFFLGDRVYKVKKPVRFEFLDFSTVAAREDACRREVALNRRLSPDVYLGVATILDPDGRPCDHAVVMRRMPDDRRLSHLLRASEAADRLREVARTLAAFHARAETSPEISAAGSPETIRLAWRDNLDEIDRFAGRSLHATRLARIRELAMRYVAGRRPLFELRVAHGKIRDGHGDLLADDIFCLPDGPRILDCIEFGDALRYGDVASDVAFLAMDLEHRGRPDLAARFLLDYREFSGDNPPTSLIHFSIAHRALVRAKVACLRAEQTGHEALGARRLVELALAHLERARPRLVMVGGFPGTGKTTLAHALARARGFAHLHSDETRKELFGADPGARIHEAFRAGIYRSGATRDTYRELLRRALALLRMGESVVIDASWTDRSLRDRAAATAAEAVADLTELRCWVPASIAAARIRTRTAGPSDATEEIASLMAEAADPWPGAVRLDAARPPDEVLGKALGALDRRPEPDPWRDLFAAPGSDPEASGLRLVGRNA
jgi:aminoglycoside phosphotransferase family enzyme/predicted kinase